MKSFVDTIEQVLQEAKNPFTPDKKDPKDLITFLKKRAAGAAKIQKSAEKKGGFSLLTSVHFKAKEIPYKNALKHAEDEDSKFIKQKADECFEKLKHWHKMSQREFQAVMGQLEAYGEVYIRSFQDKGN